MRAAAILDIPFVTLDLEKEYKEEVVDYMVREYKAGLTPNPDVMCNKEIKFGAFLKWAKERGEDFVATGHYARIGFASPESRRSRDDSPDEVLLEAKDKNKDQSYFLWTLAQNQLKHILFPVGAMKKEEVRKLALKFGLPQATRKDSQGLCFLGQVDMKEFLSAYIPAKKGDVLDKNGKIIGFHNGAVFFTIGERHGYSITKKTPGDKPLYVISKDINNNTITVAEQITPHEKSQGAFLILESVNWVSGYFPENKNLWCRLRYRQEKIPCNIEREKNKIKVLLKESQYISPGQSLVFYDGEMCLGGGIMR
jgi:tRNA-specific 2-thiouridylase